MPVAYLLQDIKTWGEVAKQNGPWFIFACVAALFVWKLLWPLVLDAQAALKEQNRLSREASEKALDAFTTALREVNEVHRQSVEKIVGRMDNLIEEVRRKN